MKMSQRLNRFLFGFVLGLILVVFFFGDRDWLGWTPNSKVLQRLRETKTEMTDYIVCRQNCIEISDDEILLMLDMGKVRFKESEVHEEEKMYIVEHETEKGIIFKAKFFALGEESRMDELWLLENDKECGCVKLVD